MFGKLKDKLKGWFKSSTEKVEETAEKTEVEEKPVKKKEKKVEKVDKKKEKRVSEKKEVSKKDAIEILSEEGAEKVVEVLEEKGSASDVSERIKKVKEEAIREIEEADEIIEKAKEEEIEEVPLEFVPGGKRYEPDILEIKDKIKEKEEEIVEEKKPEKDSFFTRLRSKFAYRIGSEEFDNIFDDLEMLLLENNVALEVVEDLRKKLSGKLIGKEVGADGLENEIRNELRNSLNEILIEPDNPLEIIKEKDEKPFVILFFGVNGTGKTTSIAKIAYFLKKAGMSVVLAAGDTFRAASIEQISEHAEKLKVPVIKHGYDSDSAAVGFDAIKYAKHHGIDVVLIDTAGRMHTKANLMTEMEKICRVTNPDLKIFVAESIAGNDAVEQARTFHESIGIDGSILSKVDVDEKGGTIISVSYATKKPIFYLGVGQEYEDLMLFNKQKFISDLGF